MTTPIIDQRCAFALHGDWLQHLPGLPAKLRRSKPNAGTALYGAFPEQIVFSIDAFLHAAKHQPDTLWVGVCSYEAASHWNWPQRFPAPDQRGFMAARFSADHLAHSPLLPQCSIQRAPRLEFNPAWTYAEYVRAFRRVQDYILAGDCYQVNLAQRLHSALPEPHDAASICQHARAGDFREPWCGWFLQGDEAILSYSPEHFLSIRDGQLTTRPIKGTRPRSPDPQKDQAQREALVSSAKDQAENLMIVDLLRNDLGAVAEVGSIRVPELFQLESHSNVHHLVSTVTGRLKPGRSPLEAFFACLPGGSITGAPKVRAMEIIRELERAARHYYCGSLFAFDGVSLASNLLIRTMQVQNRNVLLHGGGGLVADSESRAEYDESLTKIRHIQSMWS